MSVVRECPRHVHGHRLREGRYSWPIMYYECNGLVYNADGDHEIAEPEKCIDTYGARQEDLIDCTCNEQVHAIRKTPSGELCYICGGVVYIISDETKTQELNFYSASSKCPACERGDVSVEYVHLLKSEHEGQMKRTCALCGYVWYERPLFEKKAPLVVTTEACDSCAAFELYEQQFQEE